MGENCRHTLISALSASFAKWDTHLANLFARLHQSLPCVKGGGTRKRDGGIVKVRLYIENNPSAAYGVSSLYTREPFNSSRNIKKAVYRCYADRLWHPQREDVSPFMFQHVTESHEPRTQFKNFVFEDGFVLRVR